MPKTMDLTTKLRQEFVLKKIEETDWEFGASNPLVVELDTTEACDLACPGCISADVMESGNRFSNERLLKLGEELYEAGVKAVVLIGGGEPLAHPVIGELMDYFGKHDIHVGITTNGTFIRKHLDTIARYASWTRVSMDAASPEMFNILRPSKTGKNRFEFIIENMRQLARVKTGKLGYSFLIQTEADGEGIKSNVDEIYDAALLARDIGCDYFEVKPSYQFRDGVDHALMKHNQNEMDRAREQVARLAELETDSFKVMKAINLDFSLDSETEPLQLKDYKTCPATELRTLICPSGSFVCPYWRGKERMRTGDVNNESFHDMWNGERRKQVMKELDPRKDCSFYCLRDKTNQSVIKLAKEIEAKKAIETVPEYDRFI